jgi:hypothetical protein
MVKMGEEFKMQMTQTREERKRDEHHFLSSSAPLTPFLVHTVHCTLHTVHCTLHTEDCIPCFLRRLFISSFQSSSLFLLSPHDTTRRRVRGSELILK